MAEVLILYILIGRTNRREGTYSHKEVESLYTNNIRRIDPIRIDEDAKIANKEKITPDSIHSTSICSKLKIQLIQNRFKLIEFNDSKKKQTRKQVKDKKVTAYIVNILIIINNNYLLFKNNIEYEWVKFI